MHEHAVGQWEAGTSDGWYPDPAPPGTHTYSGSINLGGLTLDPGFPTGYSDGFGGEEDKEASLNHWVTVSGGTFQCSCDLDVTASANCDGQYMGSVYVDCSYTCDIEATPYGMHYAVAPTIDNVNGTLTFFYAWWSTTGDINDLATTIVYEHVEYPGAPSSGYATYSPPNPPFNYTEPYNPLDWRIQGGSMVPNGDIGGMVDIHNHGPLVDGYDGYTATQEYRFYTPGVHGDPSLGSYDVMGNLGAAHPIVRLVVPNPPYVQTHKYSVTKDGYVATYVY